MKTKRTKAQQALLDRLPKDGSPKRFTGRARSMVGALAKEGAITYAYRPPPLRHWQMDGGVRGAAGAQHATFWRNLRQFSEGRQHGR